MEDEKILTVDNFVTVATNVGSVVPVGTNRPVVVVCSESVKLLGNTLYKITILSPETVMYYVLVKFKVFPMDLINSIKSSTQNIYKICTT